MGESQNGQYPRGRIEKREKKSPLVIRSIKNMNCLESQREPKEGAARKRTSWRDLEKELGEETERKDERGESNFRVG